MRDRLIELIGEAKAIEASGIDCKVTYEYIADYLLANGVIVPPCKVGDTVYALKGNGTIVKGTVESIHQNLVGNEQGRWIVTSTWLQSDLPIRKQIKAWNTRTPKERGVRGDG